MSELGEFREWFDLSSAYAEMVREFERDFKEFLGIKHEESKDLQYCLECLIKHLSAAVKLAEEAVDYYIAKDDRWVGFIRKVVDELAGVMWDIRKPPKDLLPVRDEIRKTRIWITRTGMDIGLLPNGVDDLKELQTRLEKILDKIYEVKKEYYERLDKVKKALIEIARKKKR